MYAPLSVDTVRVLLAGAACACALGIIVFVIYMVYWHVRLEIDERKCKRELDALRNPTGRGSKD